MTKRRGEFVLPTSKGGLCWIVVSHRELLRADELHGVPLDGVQRRVGRVAGVGGRRRRQRHVGLAGLRDLDPPHRHQLHQLREEGELVAYSSKHQLSGF